MERSGLPRTRQKRTSSTSAHRKTRVLAISIDGRFLDEISTIAPPGSCMHLEPASSLQEGVSKLESSPFDAVILELKPTDDDAWLALHIIRETAPETALVVLVEVPETAMTAMERGADDYLARGAFDEAVCLRVLRHAIERRAWERQLRSLKQVHAQVHERLGIGLFELELDGSLRSTNDVLRRMLGWQPGKPGLDLARNGCRSPQHFRAWFGDLERARGTLRRKVAFRTREGREVIGMTSVHPCYDELGRKVGYRGAVMDITDIALQAEDLPYQASHDLESGLYNARMFERVLERACEELPDGGGLAVCIIRLDLGEAERLCGDSVARELRRCLSVALDGELLREDVAARLEEDVFAVMFRARTPAAALEKACRIVERIQAVSFEWAGHILRTTAVAGVAYADAPQSTPAAILAAADNGCERARADGRTVALAEIGPAISKREVDEMRWAAFLKAAYADEALELHYQVILPLQRTVAERERYDVLVRYAGFDGALHRPAAFMAAVGRYNLASTLDLAVVETLLRSNAFPAVDGPRPWFVIRLSNEALAEPTFPEALRARIERTSFPRRSLCFAITQRAVEGNPFAVRRLVAALKALRCELMLEQHGEPLSVGALRDLTPAYLRLGPSVIRGIQHDRMSREFVQGLVGIARVTGTRVVASFVEDSKDLPVLEQCGVDYAQGFAVGAPGPVARLRVKDRC